MLVVEAGAAGMCFGVRDALKILADLPDPAGVTVHGELVHNEVVLHRLAVRGFRQSAEADRDAIPETPAVLVTAHGVSDRERGRLAAAGKTVIDTTCPLVKRAHAAALKLRDAGYFVVVIGRPGHVEVRGLTEDLPRHAVVENEAAAVEYPAARIGVVCQTTTPPPHAAAVLAAVVRRNPLADVKFVDTICHPTKDHQKSLAALLPGVDAVVVVGGTNSNNTKELVRMARDRGTPAFHVTAAADVKPEWFAGFTRVGLTAGTSTLDETIREVRGILEAIGA